VGPACTSQFVQRNGLQCVLRAHQNQRNGYDISEGHEGQVVTIFSASAYTKLTDLGAIAVLTKGQGAESVHMCYTQWSANDVRTPMKSLSGGQKAASVQQEKIPPEVQMFQERVVARKEMLLEEFQRLETASYRFGVRGMSRTGWLSIDQWTVAMQKVFPRMEIHWPSLGAVLGLDPAAKVVNYQEFLQKLEEGISRQGVISGLYASLGPMQGLFHFLDENNDGMVSRDEFDNFWTTMRKDLQSTHEYEAFMGGNNEQTLERDLDKLFNILDIDGDGVVTLDELFKACRKFRHRDWMHLA